MSGYSQSSRYYNPNKDTVSDCGVMSQSEQVCLKQSAPAQLPQSGGSAAPLPCRFFNPQCGCMNSVDYSSYPTPVCGGQGNKRYNCPMNCPTNFGSDSMRVNLEKASSGGILNQVGSGPVGAPLYVTSPSGYSELYAGDKQSTGDFQKLQYNFTPNCDGVKFVPVRR
jgi:hypothetical protein